MPRIAQQPTSVRQSTNPLLAASTSHPNVLKRNQACHQCRKRKLKCDAQRPCGTCVRTHNHQVNHATPGKVLPAEPDCTFDDIAEISVTVSEGPRNRYEKLENRISELEALLRQKEISPQLPLIPYQAQMSVNEPDVDMSLQASVSPHADVGFVIEASSGPYEGNTNLQRRAWPPGLPGQPLLRSLVDAFFSFQPHATQLFHQPTFLRSLDLPPEHKKFPSAPVLHAICAIASLYNSSVTSPPYPNFDVVPVDEIFLERFRDQDQVDSFSEEQAKLAKSTADHLNSIGKDLISVLQANIILTWFYWAHGRWVDVFISSAHSMRLSVPLGLNICQPFHSITKTERPHSILPMPHNVYEDETRRNAFWLAYITERQHGLGNGWALSLDDQDVAQLMPLCSEDFHNLNLVEPPFRQWSHAQDILLNNTIGIVDPFILYVKGTMMLSQVKAFNLRFKAKAVASNLSMTGPPNGGGIGDARASPAFIQLEQIASSFRAQFPSHLSHPFRGEVLDRDLYTTFHMPFVAIISLHDPHAEVQQHGCLSALKILTAARGILDLIHTVQSSSYDITLLDPFCSFSWFIAGRVFVRFLKAAIEARSEEQILGLTEEISFCHTAIARIGERIPLARRYAAKLSRFAEEECGFKPGPSVVVFPRTREPLVLQALFHGHVSLHEPLHEPGSFLSLA